MGDEVRTLAGRTHQSTQEIQQMIEQLQEGSSKAVAVMERGRTQADLSVQQAARAGESLKAVSESSNLILDMNTQIASSADEQNVVSDDISRSITTISHMLEQTTEGAKEISQVGVSVAEQASQLQAVLKKFQL